MVIKLACSKSLLDSPSKVFEAAVPLKNHDMAISLKDLDGAVSLEGFDAVVPLSCTEKQRVGFCFSVCLLNKMGHEVLVRLGPWVSLKPGAMGLFDKLTQGKTASCENRLPQR